MSVVPFARMAAIADCGSARMAGSVTTRIAATGSQRDAATPATMCDSMSTATTPVRSCVIRRAILTLRELTTAIFGRSFETRSESLKAPRYKRKQVMIVLARLLDQCAADLRLPMRDWLCGEEVVGELAGEEA